jgi:hypothetical protein
MIIGSKEDYLNAILEAEGEGQQVISATWRIASRFPRLQSRWLSVDSSAMRWLLCGRTAACSLPPKDASSPPADGSTPRKH